METPKTNLRKWARAQRRGLVHAAISAAICQHLATWLAQQQASQILVYWAMQDEPDLAPLVNLWPARYFLPRMEGANLVVHSADEPLLEHSWGLREPLATAPRLPADQLDAVLIPCLAADWEGYRLGYGKGYYDRFVAQLPGHIPTVGVVAQELVLARLPRDDWDQPLKFLATQQGITAVSLII